MPARYKTRKPFVDFYTVLKVDRKANDQELQRAYRRLSLKVHPDKRPASEKARANAEFILLRDALDVLTEFRRQFDVDLSRHERALKRTNVRSRAQGGSAKTQKGGRATGTASGGGNKPARAQGRNPTGYHCPACRCGVRLEGAVPT